ncbi:MAG: 1,4-dihydroxy-2-naphthoate octaprenyltransferase [Planctomycetota bacterium]
MILFLACRPKFLVASISPILVGTSLGYGATGNFEPLLFVFAALSIIFLHAGANIANDYFDHTSRNDWVNRNPTPFSGGRRFIQQNILSPKATLILALFALAIGSAIGLFIVILTESTFILVLGIVGLLGGYFYTADPVRLSYRGVGEFVIMLLFGFLPIFGAYYLQTGNVDAFVFWPAAIISILIFLIILINEFPDLEADRQVGKKTLVVLLGPGRAVWVYRVILLISFALAGVAMFISRLMLFAALPYLLTLPLAIALIKTANKQNLTTVGKFTANRNTILLHTVGTITMSLGFATYGLLNFPE